jgi:hypothetical protein
MNTSTPFLFHFLVSVFVPVVVLLLILALIMPSATERKKILLLGGTKRVLPFLAFPFM